MLTATMRLSRLTAGDALEPPATPRSHRIGRNVWSYGAISAATPQSLWIHRKVSNYTAI